MSFYLSTGCRHILLSRLGAAIVKSHFPEWDFDFETYYLSSLLHDIGTAPEFFMTTKMSFEFKGGITARDFLIQNGAPEEQADQVCETIIRHQDIFVKGGNITEIGQIIQLATILGMHSSISHFSF
jgi:cyanamide hydratase